MPRRPGSAMPLSTKKREVEAMSSIASNRNAPLSKLTKRLPKPDEPRTFGAKTAMPLRQQRLIVVTESRLLLPFGTAVKAQDSRIWRLTRLRSIEPTAQGQTIMGAILQQARPNQLLQCYANMRAAGQLARVASNRIQQPDILWQARARHARCQQGPVRRKAQRFDNLARQFNQSPAGSALFK